MLNSMQQLIRCVSPKHGRILIYVWAVEQDELSKRRIPGDPRKCHVGQDVFVPWVLSKQRTDRNHSKITKPSSDLLLAEPTEEPTVYHRYYHLFDEGELVALTRSAVEELGLNVLAFSEQNFIEKTGVEIVQEGWERSNYYVELRRWEYSG
jgi:tRNA (uracil-5-)-methyltransferase TRM9